MEQPYVSVIVPAFNAGSTLKECLQSLHTQTYPHEHYEVIVVDDGSTDQTPVIAQSESRTVFLQQTHEGPATARNLGSLHARGNILIFTDADCTASETFIEEMVKPFNDPHIVGVKGAYRSLQKGCWARFAQIEFEERYAKLVKAESIDFVDSHAAAFRKDTFCEVGGFDPHFPVANNEDVDLSYKIARLGYRMVFNPNAIVFHHHPDNALRYLRTKFLRAYWRMLVYRRFPEKILSDTYTPQTLKIQIAFTALIFLNLFLGLFKPAALYGLIYLIAGFLLATLPFIYRVSKHDPKLILFSEFALFCRSLVFGLGVIAGFLSQRRRDLLFPTILIISDIIASFAAYTGAFWIRIVPMKIFLGDFDHTFIYYVYIYAGLALPFWFLSFHARGLYNSRIIGTGVDEFAKVTKAITLSVFAIITVSFFVKGEFSRAVILIYWILAIIITNVTRQAIASFQAQMRYKGYQRIRTIIVGTGDTGVMLLRAFRDNPSLGITVLGVVDERKPDPNDSDWKDVVYLGPLSELDGIIKNASADDVYIARPDIPHQDILDIVVHCEKTGAGFKIVSDLVSIVTGAAGISPLAGLSIVDLREEKHDWGRRVIKRILDLVIGTIMLLFLLPIMIIIGVAVHLSLPGSILVKEERVGKNGRLFKMFRFRVHPHGFLPVTAVPSTFIGKFLRKSYLEELPQLLNVLRGEMSLVGPRPEVPEIVATYADWQRKRLQVPPGITGLWQIITPGDQPLHNNLEYDFYYIKNYNIWMDLSLLLHTIPHIIFGKGRLGM